MSKNSGVLRASAWIAGCIGAANLNTRTIEETVRGASRFVAATNYCVLASSAYGIRSISGCYDRYEKREELSFTSSDLGIPASHRLSTTAPSRKLYK